MRRSAGTWAVVAAVAAAVGCFYLWNARAAGDRFIWDQDLGGYYDYLGRAFAHGKLTLPLKPAPELLALPNPWDPAAYLPYGMHDMVLYKGRYYLYHGAGPAVLLFAPWRVVTGHDLPENFALFLLSFGGFLFSCGALLRLLELAEARPGPLLLAVMLVALGVCQSVPYLLNRVAVYEIAIGGGYFCLCGAVFFLARGWLAASGLMFGLTIACRPHLGLAGVIALVALVALRTRRRGLIAFVVPFALMGAAIAGYNYLRFGDPFEFGLRYLLCGPHQNQIKLAAGNILPGLYYMLLSPPDFSAVFPWVRLVFRFPFNSPGHPFPPEYFIEPVVGAFYLAPLLVAAVLAPATRVRVLLGAMLASSTAVLLFLTATGFTTHRYMVDFLPVAVLAAIASAGIYISKSAGIKKAALGAALTILVAYSAVANMALGITGPYDDMLKNRPKSYVHMAQWFSPVERFRPLLNPRLTVEFTAEFTPQPDQFHEPLITTGQQAWRYFLYVEHLPGKLRLISRTDASTVAYEMDEPGNQPVRIRATYSPASRKLVTSVNGQEVLVHDIGTLVTAPAQVTIGENRIDVGMTVPRFTGRIQGVVKSVAE